MTKGTAQGDSPQAFTHEQILELLERVSHLGIEELEVEFEEYRLRIAGRKAPRQVIQQAGANATADGSAASQTPLSEPAAVPSESTLPVPAPAKEKEEEDLSRFVKVTAPMIGTFYRSPAPDAPSFVEQGDDVDENTVLCIIEAMKLMNEIKAETRGTVKRILVDNAQPVEYGQPIFLIEPYS